MVGQRLISPTSSATTLPGTNPAQFGGGSGASQWPRLKKMYLILVLTTVCVFFLQYNVSKAQLTGSGAAEARNQLPPEMPPIVIIGGGGGGESDHLRPRHQEPMRELLLADSAQSTAPALPVVLGSASGSGQSDDNINNVINIAVFLFVHTAIKSFPFRVHLCSLKLGQCGQGRLAMGTCPRFILSHRRSGAENSWRS